MESEAPVEVGRLPRDARYLVERMVAAGEWPEPEIVEQIVAAGDEAVDPLLEILATNPRGWPEEAPLDHAIGLLGEIGSPRALPALVDVIRRYKGDTGESAADAIVRFGEEGFGTLLGLILDPGIVGYQRSKLVSAARGAAGDDPDRKDRLAEVLRQVFGQLAVAARELHEREAEPGHDDTHGRDDLDDEAAMNAVPPDEELSFVVGDLSELADPLSRDMIQDAFDRGLVDTSIIDVDDVRKYYTGGGRASLEPISWLQEYRERLADEMDSRRRVAEMRPIEFPSRSSYPSFEPMPSEPWPVPARSAGPIRRASTAIGRNDPCWCGSGKKYKKCHLGKDGRS
jgi:hypothetical protein